MSYKDTMKIMRYSGSRKKFPLPALSPIDYLKVHNLDFYYETRAYGDIVNDKFWNLPHKEIKFCFSIYTKQIRDYFKLLFRGEIPQFPKGYFTNPNKNIKCKAVLVFLYLELYKFSDYEIKTMNHRKFLIDISLVDLVNKNLFPTIEKDILEAININRIKKNKFTMSDLKGSKYINIAKRAEVVGIKIIPNKRGGIVTKKANFVTGHNITGAIKSVESGKEKQVNTIKSVKLTISDKVKLMEKKKKLEDALSIIKRKKSLGKPYSEDILNKLTKHLIEINKILKHANYRKIGN